MTTTSEGLDLIDRVRELSRRANQHLDNIQTEEATKTALVLPFISDILGYDVRDPTEVVPEFTADVGTKKGEKVDYAIFKGGKPILLLECKRFGTDLKKAPRSQLYRYFGATDARFGVLTDGVTYRFFSDVDAPNRMDLQPFLAFDLLNITEAEVEELRSFTKASFDSDRILGRTKDLKYAREVMRLLTQEWTTPSAAFVKLFSRKVRPGNQTQAVVKQFTLITKKVLQQFVEDRIQERFNTAQEIGRREETAKEEEGVRTDAGVEAGDTLGKATTDEEWQGFFAVKAIVSQDVSPERVTIRDVQSYCGILLDNNNRKPICRLHFNREKKYLGIFGQGKAEERVPIDSIDEIFRHADQIRASAKRYLITED